MAGGRDAVKLSEDEVQALLGENLKVQVASNGPDGVPHLTTLFYIVRDGQDRVLDLRPQPEDRQPRARPAGERARRGRHRLLRAARRVDQGQGRDRARLRRDLLDIGSEVATRMVAAESFEALGDFGRETVEKQATEARRRDHPSRRTSPPGTTARWCEESNHEDQGRLRPVRVERDVRGARPGRVRARRRRLPPAQHRRGDAGERAAGATGRRGVPAGRHQPRGGRPNERRASTARSRS